MLVGKAASAVLFGMGRGPVMIYSGQEIGEAGGDLAGFSQDVKRTTVFDYWSMKEFVKWVNGGKYDGALLGDAQKRLRAWYGKLLSVLAQPGFTKGEFYGLNFFNRENEYFGRLEGEEVSGHWLYSFLRHDAASWQSFLMIANFHPTQDMAEVRVRIPRDAWDFLGRSGDEKWAFTDRLEGSWHTVADRDLLEGDGVLFGELEALNVAVLEISKW